MVTRGSGGGNGGKSLHGGEWDGVSGKFDVGRCWFWGPSHPLPRHSLRPMANSLSREKGFGREKDGGDDFKWEFPRVERLELLIKLVVIDSLFNFRI